MDFDTLGISVLHEAAITSLRERDFVSDDGRYMREYSIEIEDGVEDLDMLNKVWGFDANVIHQFKNQVGSVRVALVEMKNVYSVDDVVKPEEEKKEDVSFEKTGIRRPVHRTRGKTNTVIKDVRVKRKQPEGEKRVLCSDEEIRQKLLSHAIHKASVDKTTEDPSQQKFTQRAGIFSSVTSCPQLYLYLRDNHIQGWQVIDKCYAKAWPYSLAIRNSRRRVYRRTFTADTRKTGEGERGEDTSYTESLYGQDAEGLHDTRQMASKYPGIPTVTPTLFEVQFEFYERDKEVNDSGSSTKP